ncbi:NUDIX domain-containing protein [Actinocorallia longicatena]|uniref:NUDIX hydrolase n=1 Tax=Actinocorallia longicatena TaxID=111803 RepID=A0ABP6QL21_9ACTN
MFVNPPGAPIEILFDKEGQEEAESNGIELAKLLDLPEDSAEIGVVYRDAFVVVVKDAVRFADGRVGSYIRALGSHEASGAAGFPLLSDGRVVLVKHFRHATRAEHWEIPRGFGSPGADVTETARRETEEELGCPVTEVIALGGTNPDSGAGGGTDGLCLVRIDAETFDGTLSDEARAEGITSVRAFAWDAFVAMIANGEIDDGYTLSAFGLILAKGLAPAPSR